MKIQLIAPAVSTALRRLDSMRGGFFAKTAFRARSGGGEDVLVRDGLTLDISPTRDFVAGQSAAGHSVAGWGWQAASVARAKEEGTVAWAL